MPRTSSRDFSKQSGRRLRVAPFRYDPRKRLFRTAGPLKPFLITVADADEERRLWRALEDTIENGGWRNGAAGDAAVPGPAEARV